MFLVKKLPDEIYTRKLYPLWHFSKYKEEELNILDFIQESNISDKNGIIDYYNNDFGSKWYGIWGASFGGKIEYLKQLYEKFNIHDNIDSKYFTKKALKLFERYIGLVG